MGEGGQYRAGPVIEEFFAERVEKVVLAAIGEQIITVTRAMRYDVIMRDVMREAFNMASIREFCPSTK